MSRYFHELVALVVQPEYAEDERLQPWVRVSAVHFEELVADVCHSSRHCLSHYDFFRSVDDSRLERQLLQVVVPLPQLLQDFFEVRSLELCVLFVELVNQWLRGRE